MTEYLNIPVAGSKDGLMLMVYPQSKKAKVFEENDLSFGESRWQLVEGEEYEYEFTQESYAFKTHELVTKMDMDYLLVMNQILITKGCSLHHLENAPYISKLRLRHILANLTENEFIETSGKTSGQKYILHVSKRKTTKEKINYSLKKRQTKARQKEAILRYLDSVGKINNPEARELLKLEPKDVSHVSRLFKELLESEDIVILSEKSKNQRVYGRKK